jgi:cyclic pyranopterin phosphate synthase
MWKIRLTGGEPLVRRDAVELVRMISGVRGVRDLAMTTNGTLLAQHAAALRAAGLQRVNVSLDTLDPGRYARITRGGRLADVLAGIEAAERSGLYPIKLNCVVRRSSQDTDATAVAGFGRSRGYPVRFIRQMHLPEGRFAVVEGGRGGDCARCDRLRLSSNGLVRPCLFSEVGFSVRELGPEYAIRRAVEQKPRCGTVNRVMPMSAIGG